MASTPSDISIRHVAAAWGGRAKKGAGGKNDADDIIVIELLDRRLIDPVHIEQLGEHIKELVNAAALPRVVISFAKVEYLSSTALNILIELDNVIKRKGGRMCLADLHPDLQKVFSLMKLTKVMQICKSTDEAVKVLES